jgi:long-subunit fatty acid transport protein
MNCKGRTYNLIPYNVQAKYIQDKTFTMGLPFGVGLKYKFNYNWALSGEFTFRPTFSDQVDYSELKKVMLRL